MSCGRLDVRDTRVVEIQLDDGGDDDDDEDDSGRINALAAGEYQTTTEVKKTTFRWKNVELTGTGNITGAADVGTTPPATAAAVTSSMTTSASVNSIPRGVSSREAPFSFFGFGRSRAARDRVQGSSVVMITTTTFMCLTMSAVASSSSEIRKRWLNV